MKRLYKTAHLNRETVERKWFEVDAEGLVLGRLSSRIATILRGKHKPTWSPHVDGGDFVVVTNAEKVQLTGRKGEQKYYLHHTGYPGGMRKTPIARVLERNPERVVRKAVWGMLPKNRLGRQMIKKLKVYSGPEHPHKAQKPEPLPL